MAAASNPIRIVLVHGGFVDGSGWADTFKILRRDGFDVTVVQNPTLSLKDDVAVTTRAITAQGGPVLLVGHSYGGAVITEAGNHPQVAGLVYIAAFAPDAGESVSSLIKDPPPGAPVPPILPPRDGFLFLDRAKFHASFAADVDPALGEFMASSQVPWGLDALNGANTTPAWKTKPSWYLVATDDRMIPPPAQRIMSKRAGSTVIEVPGSHSVYVSQPGPVEASPGSRADALRPGEDPGEVALGGVSAGGRDVPERVLRALEEAPGPFQAPLGQPAMGGHAGRLAEGPGEMPDGELAAPGQVRE